MWRCDSCGCCCLRAAAAVATAVVVAAAAAVASVSTVADLKMLEWPCFLRSVTMTSPRARWPSAYADWDELEDDLRSDAAAIFAADAAFARFERAAALDGVISVGLNSVDVAVLPRSDDDNDEQAVSVNSSGAVSDACDAIDCFFARFNSTGS